MTIAPLPTGLGVRTRLVDDPVRLLDLLPDREGALAWVRGGDGLVGWGEVARLSPMGPNRFVEADRWWRSFAASLSVDDQVGVPGTGPVAFTSFTFADETPGSVLVVPRVVVGRRDGVAWITEFSHGDGMHAVRPVRPPGSVRYADGQLSVAGYRQAVAEAVRRMRDGELDKVVLAHDLLAITDAPLDARHLLAGLSARYPACWSFSVDGLVGATPELLMRRQAGSVWSRVLAGTIWPGPATSADLGDVLLGSAKDRHEHRLAINSLADTLRPLCTELSVPDEPAPLVLHNVTHLASDVQGTLPAEAPASLLELAAAVHPTAAVGGTPAFRCRADDRGTGGDGPGALRGAGRLGRRRRRRRARHRPALRVAGRARGPAVRGVRDRGRLGPGQRGAGGRGQAAGRPRGDGAR